MGALSAVLFCCKSSSERCLSHKVQAGLIFAGTKQQAYVNYTIPADLQTVPANRLHIIHRRKAMLVQMHASQNWGLSK